MTFSTSMLEQQQVSHQSIEKKESHLFEIQVVFILFMLKYSHLKKKLNFQQDVWYYTVSCFPLCAKLNQS